MDDLLEHGIAVFPLPPDFMLYAEVDAILGSLPELEDPLRARDDFRPSSLPAGAWGFWCCRLPQSIPPPWYSHHPPQNLRGHAGKVYGWIPELPSLAATGHAFPPYTEADTAMFFPVLLVD